MFLLITLLGFAVSFVGLGSIGLFIDGAVDAGIVFLLFDLFVLVPPFVLLIIYYNSPRSKAKREQAKEKRAAYIARLDEEKAQRKEEQRLRTTIVATKLLGEAAAEYKKSVGDMVVRGAVGSIFGTAGAVIGAATAKDKNVNKNVRRFLVKYLDGHIEEKEATIGSLQYKIYMEHLVWEE